MAKISELSTEKLHLYVQKYEGKLQADPADADASKKLNAIKAELAARGDGGEKPAAAPAPAKRASTGVAKASGKKSAVKKHHSSKEDTSSYENAGFLLRAAAIIIDAIIMMVAITIINTVFGIISGMVPALAVVIGLLLMVLNLGAQYGYMIFMTYKYEGQTLGKKLMKIKVLSSEPNTELSIGAVIIREIPGKIISSIVLLLGFIWVALGKEAWHDSIAKTKVVKVS